MAVETGQVTIISTEPFTGLAIKEKDKTLWNISTKGRSGRFALTNEGVFKFSDVSTESIKRYAEINYGINPDLWKKV